MGRCFESGVVKEGMDCREAQIASANADALVLLKLIEERHNQRRIDVLQVQPEGGGLCSRCCTNFRNCRKVSR